jgi:hypothetical protein
MVWLAVQAPSAVSWLDRRIMDLKERMRAADPRRSHGAERRLSKDYWAASGSAG